MKHLRALGLTLLPPSLLLLLLHSWLSRAEFFSSRGSRPRKREFSTAAGAVAPSAAILCILPRQSFCLARMCMCTMGFYSVIAGTRFFMRWMRSLR